VYRPSPSRKNGLKPKQILEEDFPKYLSKYIMLDSHIVIVGDLNFHFDNPQNNNANKFKSCLESFGLKQHVNVPTHVAGHTLDVVITRDNDNTVSNINVYDPVLSNSNGNISKDYFAVTFNARASRPPPTRKTVTYKKLRSIDIDSFKTDIKACEILNNDSEITSIDEYVDTIKSFANS